MSISISIPFPFPFPFPGFPYAHNYGAAHSYCLDNMTDISVHDNMTDISVHVFSFPSTIPL